MTDSSSSLHPNLDGAVWRKARRSQGSTGNCVEVARAADIVAVRDSKDPHGPVLILSLAAACRTAVAIKRGDHDL
ncbi:DUF397 domain-containing protein [Thermomonospora catenispora]|uniref:DUF397 domain-containing protein n=1 Tax=Thermomonospora catenispora TaxID=2493090 RepID=UPI00111F9FCE|nr:DUF397 domain-containing protein [Thermomonospora catenispora]TNY37559.1 DUF397 domain-containing protein [Thermomonospora catenispora]